MKTLGGYVLVKGCHALEVRKCHIGVGIYRPLGYSIGVFIFGDIICHIVDLEVGALRLHSGMDAMEILKVSQYISQCDSWVSKFSVSREHIQLSRSMSPVGCLKMLQCTMVQGSLVGSQ